MTHADRTLSYIVPFFVVIGATAAFAWQLHHPSPCAAAPETCRPAWREAQS